MPPPSPDLLRIGCCSDHFSQSPQGGHFAASSRPPCSSAAAWPCRPLLCRTASLCRCCCCLQSCGLLTRALRRTGNLLVSGQYQHHTPLSPSAPRTQAEGSTGESTSSPVFCSVNSICFSLPRYLQPSCPPEQLAAAGCPNATIGKNLPFPSANGQIIFVSFYWEQPQLLTFLAEILSLCLHLLLTDSSIWI